MTAGPEKPEAYSLEYGEDFSAPRTMQMLVHHSPQEKGSIEQAPISSIASINLAKEHRAV
jgi:hypothetical protein